MQNNSFKKLSILGLALMAVSAVTAAIIPAKAKNGSPSRDFAPGLLILSSSGDGGITVIAGPGFFSYTETGFPCDNFDLLSATSYDDVWCTITAEMGCYTLDDTTDETII